MKKLYGLLMAILVTSVGPLAAQESGITKQQADQILDELRRIRQLLETQAAQAKPGQPAAPLRAKLNLEGYEMLGSKNAPLTIVEFTDYQCPYCERFHTATFPELKKQYIDTGKARFFSKDLPLDIHGNAMQAAQAARCAKEQGKFWELRELMSANPNSLGLDQILGFAGGMGINGAKLRECITSGKYKEPVQADVLEAMRIGAQGTPTFVIGTSTPDGVDGEVMDGAQPFAVFDAKLKAVKQ